ncbi:hypothetical protein pgond44_14488 [Psychroflexus gondwanensis ACAM 44]|jgi:hypothetical protein|uniref:VWFA domain-containing protein n=1 Tax=Psychroflexus gondwanensis ACAM 44 TaxID=1189619 RepID=N1WI42_9FLAO|nr:hypothetical protein [Psychroflexus gondwanensis]EMY79931.1 hypothetical protein pgond44_14488 [Psychroflexus gondwanensis ACAM 44]
MKSYTLLTIIIINGLFSLAFANEENTSENLSKRKPINYTIILDLSDRVLNQNQLSYDFAQIELIFKKFKKKAKQNLIITSKDRFVLKIIPQKGSSLDLNYYENILQLRLDQLSIKDKNKRLEKLESILTSTLEKLKKEAVLGKKHSDYAGVDLWSFLNNNKENLTSAGYDNTIIIMTDGYLDFENNNHVIEQNNHFTGTNFLKDLNGNDWKLEAKNKDIGILPISLDFKATWIVTGIKSKEASDLYQISKVKYFWNKWIKQSANTHPLFINYSTKSQILSELNSIIN